MLLAVEASPPAQRIIAAAVKLAVQSKARVLVLSVRERGYTRGFTWDVRPAGEVAEVVSQPSMTCDGQMYPPAASSSSPVSERWPTRSSTPPSGIRPTRLCSVCHAGAG